MQQHWVVVADAARARILASAGPNDLHEIYAFTHPESRNHDGDLAEGGKGEVIESKGSSTRRTEPKSLPTEKEAERFARAIAEFLEKHRQQENFEDLVLVAEPQMLGRLRGQLNSQTANCVTRSIDKDWTQQEPKTIRERLFS